jgi:hypothetical protein
MANELVKRFIKKDCSQRISFYREEYAENPRDMTDEPLHCEDWSRDYSIMNKHERETKSENARSWIRYMLERYGNTKAIFEVLRNNAKSDKHDEGDNALVYDKSRHEWILNYWNGRWTDWYGEIHGNCWSEEASFCCKIKDLTAWDIASYLSDEQIEAFADKKYFTDGIKMMSYSFGYYGEISFDSEFSTDSEGICWLEKDEFLKYSGCKEEYWNGKSLDEIEFLLRELKAWSDNKVYGYVVEDCINSKIHKEYTNVDKDDEDYEDEEWEELDSCWGFYGELNKSLEWMFGMAGLNKEDFEEVAV